MSERDKTGISEWLEGIGHNRSWLAKELGVTRQCVYQWTTGDRPVPTAQAARIKALAGEALAWGQILAPGRAELAHLLAGAP